MIIFWTPRKGIWGYVGGSGFVGVWVEGLIGVELDLFRPQMKSLKQTYQLKSEKQEYQIKNLKQEGQIKWLQ